MAMRARLECNGYVFEIPANAYPMYPHAERLNCVYADSATGKRFTVNLGPTRINASIFWKYISYGKAKEYENFLLDKIQMGLVPFTIITPDYNDFGKGMGVPIENAFYSGPAELKEIILLNGASGMFYDIELPYMFVRNEI